MIVLQGWGRAGRDQKPAWCWLLYHSAPTLQPRKYKDKFTGVLQEAKTLSLRQIEERTFVRTMLRARPMRDKKPTVPGTSFTRMHCTLCARENWIPVDANSATCASVGHVCCELVCMTLLLHRHQLGSWECTPPTAAEKQFVCEQEGSLCDVCDGAYLKWMLELSTLPVPSTRSTRYVLSKKQRNDLRKDFQRKLIPLAIERLSSATTVLAENQWSGLLCFTDAMCLEDSSFWDFLNLPTDITQQMRDKLGEVCKGKRGIVKKISSAHKETRRVQKQVKLMTTCKLF